jgi:thioesterase domain-containing protein
MDVSPAIQVLENGIAFVQRCGLKVEELRRGYVRCCMPLQGNVNHIGTMYAGALFTLAEIPGGALFLSSFDTARYFPIVKALDLRFTRPVDGDAVIEVALPEARVQEIQAQADADGKAEFELQAEIRNRRGETVAVSHGVYQLRSLTPRTGPACPSAGD